MDRPLSRSKLLADVAAAIVASGYAVEPPKPRRGRKPSRGRDIAEIAQDDRLTSHAQHTRAALIADVMERYNVSASNARKLICMARRLADPLHARRINEPNSYKR